MPVSVGSMLEDFQRDQHRNLLMRVASMSTNDAAADVLAGGGLARGMAVGRPLLSGAMGVLGLDPFSLGMRAGGFAWGHGAGVLGAGAAGLGMLGGAAVLGTGAAWAGGQVMHGVHQQMGLNHAMRALPFMNGQGGMGMTSAQSFGFGQDMRAMAGQHGPGGEVVGFDELARLASTMGRMGMGEGVRTAREFKDKFKQTIDTLKVVAHELGTTLEEGLRFMNEQKRSGIFGRGDQIRMAGGMRTASLAGGLAMSEVSAAAGIGSQIARAVGGAGRQGAFAGMRTIEQIGVAQRVGALSEEDIYNATGQTGAEGRQALAAAQMQQSARFLSTGRGRRFLASVADRDGQLDEDAVSEWMGGGMTTGRTMELWHGKQGRIGRANFIRNEGRLRGAALERFGGLAQSMAYQQWLGSRGYDPNNMDDKAMLAFQRFSGMGRDEADVAIKQLQAMPETLRALQETERNTGYADSLQRYKSTTGLSGLKKQFEQTREHVQSMFQNAGSKILQGAQEQVEGWFNKVMGLYVDTASEGIEQAVGGMRLGGSGAGRQYERLMGGAGKAALSGAPGLGGRDMSRALQNQGYQIAAALGSGDRAVLDYGKGNAEFIKSASLAAAGGASSYDSLRTFRYEIAQRAKGDASSRALLEKFDKADTQGQYAMMQTLQQRAGVGESGQILSMLRGQQGGLTPGGLYHSEGEFYSAIGRRLSGQMDTEEARYAKTGWLARAAGSLFGADEGGLTADGSRPAATKRDVANWLSRKWGSVTGEEDQFRAVGQSFKESLGLISDMNSPDKDVSGSARLNALDEMQRTRGSKGWGDLSEGDRGKLRALGGSLVASKYGELLDRAAKGEKVNLGGVFSEYSKLTGDAGSEDEKRRLLIAMRREGAGAAGEQQLANALKAINLQQSGIMADRESLARRGIARVGENGQIELLARGRSGREGMSSGQLAADDLGLSLAAFDVSKPSDGALDEQIARAGLPSREAFDALPEDKKRTLRMLAGSKEYTDKTGELYQSVGAMSLKEKRDLARRRGGTLQGKAAGYEAQVEQRFASMSKRSGGEAGALARMLGLDEETAKSLGGLSGDSAVDEIMSQAGLQNAKLGTELKGALGRSSIGGRAAGIDAALANLTAEDKKKLQERSASQQDPSYRALDEIRKNSEKQARSLDILVRSNADASKYLQQMAEGNPEGSGQKP